MHILLKFFQKITEEGTLPNSLYEATITLIPKQDKHNTENKNCRLVVGREECISNSDGIG